MFLHGGPGAGSAPNHRRFFDPAFYQIVLYDQRGAGKSLPHAETRGNTTAHLVDESGHPTTQARDEILTFLTTRLTP